MSKFKPHIALLVCNILWAMDYPFYNIVLPEYVHPMAMVSGSLIATALLSLIPLAWEKSEKVARTDIRRLIGAALLIGVLRKAFINAPLTVILPIWMGTSGVFAAEAVSQLLGGLASSITMYFTVYRPLGKLRDGTPVQKEHCC